MYKRILGYYANDEPIYPTKTGCVYTAACIMCASCRVVIRTAGGPSHGSLCVACHEDKQHEEKT